MARIRSSPRLLKGDEFFEAAGVPRAIVDYEPSARVFIQGAPADSVMFLRKGQIKLSVVSRSGKEAVVGLLGRGDFFGEGSLAGQPTRMATATALTNATVVVVEKTEMAARLHARPELADRFLSHMLMRNIRIEEDLSSGSSSTTVSSASTVRC